MTRYRDIAFIQGEDACPLIDLLDDDVDKFIDYVIDTYGGHGENEPRDVEPWAANDTLYRHPTHDGELVISVNWKLPYVGVTAVQHAPDGGEVAA